MTKFSMLLAQAAAPAEGSPGGMNGLVGLLPIVLMFGAMYFLLIAPQRKKQKEHEKMMSALQPGDEIITTGGIYGTITGVKDDRFIVRVGDNNQKLEIAKGFIHQAVKRATAS
ncbi:MAG TPA: preprotein translocase subunit YajC [Candidatus Didemnitutus sp.]|nr:preprotein translocase subunit YajC [Candidatus Didemnitutus sp.]